MSGNQQETAGSRLFGPLFLAVVLYFTWKAEPLISYFNRPMFLDAMWRNADDMSTLVLAFLIDASDKALLLLTITAPLSGLHPVPKTPS